MPLIAKNTQKEEKNLYFLPPPLPLSLSLSLSLSLPPLPPLSPLLPLSLSSSSPLSYRISNSYWHHILYLFLFSVILRENVLALKCPTQAFSITKTTIVLILFWNIQKHIHTHLHKHSHGVRQEQIWTCIQWQCRKNPIPANIFNINSGAKGFYCVYVCVWVNNEETEL